MDKQFATAIISWAPPVAQAHACWSVARSRVREGGHRPNKLSIPCYCWAPGLLMGDLELSPGVSALDRLPEGE